MAWAAAADAASTWADGLQRSGDTAARRCDNTTSNSRRQPPRTAFCIAGAARTFTVPLVQAALWHHLVRAFTGGDATGGSRVFFHLKTADSDKRHEPTGVTWMKYHARRFEPKRVEEAVRQWHEWIGAAVIVHGSGSVGEPMSMTRESGAPPRAVEHVQSNSSAWRAYRSTCVRELDTRNNATRYISWGNNEERLILSHLGQQWCREAISRHEAASGRAFELVVFARPDIYWHAPVGPWCGRVAPKSALESAPDRPSPVQPVQLCIRAACDAHWSAPRESAMKLLSQAEEHQACAHYAPSTWPLARRTANARVFTDCCTDAERLLWWTARTHEMPVELSLPAPGVTSYSMLRSVEGVCDVIFDERYRKGSMWGWQKEREGLPWATGAALKARFGVAAQHEANATAADALLRKQRALADCHAALETRPTRVLQWMRAPG